MKKPKRKMSKDKQRVFWLVGIFVFAVIGIACFVVGYGLADGWEAVAAWFVSKYAMWVYAFLAVYVCFALWYLVFKKNEDTINGK